MVKWIEHELNGYWDDRASIPTYRHLRGEAKVWNPYRGYQPLHFGGSGELADRATMIPFDQPISEIAELARGKGGFACTYSPKIEAQFMRAMEIPLQPSLHFDKSQALGILDAVRTAVLKWSIELEKKGIHGSGMTFSTQEEEKAVPSRTTFNIETYIGGSMHQSQIQRDVQGAVQKLTVVDLDLDEVRKVVEQLESALRAASLPAAALDEVQSDLASIKAQLASPKPKQPFIRECLKSVRNVLEGAGGSIAASGILTALSTLIGQ